MRGCHLWASKVDVAALKEGIGVWMKRVHPGIRKEAWTVRPGGYSCNYVRNLANSAIQILSCLLYGRRLVERSAINVFCHLKKTWNPSSQVRSLSVNVVAPALHLSPNPRRLVDRFLESCSYAGDSVEATRCLYPCSVIC